VRHIPATSIPIAHFVRGTPVRYNSAATWNMPSRQHGLAVPKPLLSWGESGMAAEMDHGSETMAGGMFIFSSAGTNGVAWASPEGQARR
jgi:hypothetical protein